MVSLKKTLFNIFKTASTFVGAVSFKNGKTLLVIDDVAKRLNLSNEIKITLVVVASGSVLYTLAFTRLPSFWSKFSADHLAQSSSESPQRSTIRIIYKGVAYTVWLMRAPFNLVNTYVGSQTILRTIGLSTDNPLSYIVGIYAAISNQVAYDIFTFKSIYTNCMNLADAHEAREMNQKPNCEWKKNTIKWSLDLGTMSFSALSFFLTREALLSMPYVKDLSLSTLTGLSIGSAISALFSEIFSKNLDLHRLIDQDGNKFFHQLTSIKSKLIFPHLLMGLIFCMTMGMSYYTGCLNLSEDMGINKSLSHFLWASILLYALFAVSGSALEFAFSVKPMLESISILTIEKEDNSHAPLLLKSEEKINILCDQAEEKLTSPTICSTLDKTLPKFVENYKNVGMFGNQIEVTPQINREQHASLKKKTFSCAIL